MSDAVNINYRLFLDKENFVQKQKNNWKKNAFLVILRQNLGNEKWFYFSSE